MKLNEDQINDIIKHLEDVNENDELEFKGAKGGLPRSFWETYSSFANTNGGVIILGISEKKGILHYEALDNITIDKLQKDLWSGVNNPSTVNINLLSNKDVEVYDSNGIKVILVNVPRADRDQCPVYIGQDPYNGTYKRGYEGDFKCNRREVQRMFADADITHTFDKQILEGYTINDIDIESLRQYRQLFNISKPDHIWSTFDDMTFLKKLGAYRQDRNTKKEGFTRAGILMFGKGEAIVEDECAPSFFPDYRNETNSGESVRWIDRMYPDGTWEANLLQFYLRTLPRLQGFLPKPFKIEANQRIDQSPAHIAIREVFVNMLVHTDYKAEGSISVRFHNGTYIFSNQGTMLVSQEQFFEGGESICRNPTLQNMFMMLGPAEKAGSGGSKIMEGWRTNNWRAPYIIERTRPDKVEFHLTMESLMQKEVIESLNSRLGFDIKTLPSDYQIVLAVSLTEKQVTNERLRYILQLHKADITVLLQRMCKKGLLLSEGYGRGTKYTLPDPITHNSENINDLFKHKEGSSAAKEGSSADKEGSSQYSAEVQRLLQKQRLSKREITTILCQIATDWLSPQEIASILHKDLKYIKDKIIPQLIADGILEREFPTIPNHPQQRYRIVNNNGHE